MGQVIRAYRQHPHHGRRGLAQEEVAAWAGLTQGQLSRIETGPAIRDLDRLAVWAQLLGIPEERLWFKLPGDDQGTPDLRPGEAVLLAPWLSSSSSRSSRQVPEPDQDDPFVAERAAALGVDLWELHDALQPMRVSQTSLRLAEDACSRLDSRYAALPPLVLLPELRKQLKHVVGWLREPQPVAYRQRLCSLAGQLAGLRAWLFFDMAEYEAADAWFSGATSAAREAEDYDLCGWLLGAQSLIPVDRDDFVTAARMVREAQALVGRTGSHTTRAWLDVLEARALAGVGDSRGFAAAQQRANKRLQRTSLDERRHGQDFAGQHLDLTYYGGLGNLLLHQSEGAAQAFQTALGNLHESRVKARAVLLLSVALAAAQAHEFDEAVARASEGLAVAGDQPIRRVWQRAQEVRRGLRPAERSQAVQQYDDQMGEFARSLERSTS